MKYLTLPLKLTGLLIAVQITSSCGSSGGGGGSTPSPVPQAAPTETPSNVSLTDLQKAYDATKQDLETLSGLEFREGVNSSNAKTITLGRQTPGVLQKAYEANPLISKAAVRDALQKIFSANNALQKVYSEEPPESLKTEAGLITSLLKQDGLTSAPTVLSADDTAAVVASIKSNEDKLDAMGLRLIPTFSMDYSSASSYQSNQMKIDFAKSKIEDATIKSSADKVKESINVLTSTPKAFEDELYFSDVYKAKKSVYSTLLYKI